jgi:hypothetical protein
MSTFRDVLSEHGISAESLVRVSRQLEALGLDGRALRQRRWKKRKHEADTSYAAANLAKPSSGRGISAQQMQAALSGQPLPPRVRGKLVRAVNALLVKRGAPALEAGALFGEVPARRGTRPEPR